LTDRQLAVIHVGRLAPEKNLDLALRAFEAVRLARPDARLVWVGDGPARAELERRCPQHFFAGMRVGEDLASHYASGDLFLFPSLTETFGNVTLEAMASGLGLIAYDYAAAAEHLGSGESGLLVAPGDEAAFIAAARVLATDPSLLARLRGRAREAVALLDWEHISDAFALALADTVAERASGRQ
jgi:glycosyltransferase involved in cell wall biosynthesis